MIASPSSPDIVVLAVGNPLLSDDGAGIHALSRLEQSGPIPPGVRLVDGGTGGPALLDAVRGCRCLIVLDAVDVGARPGTIVRVEIGTPLPASPLRSVHEGGLATLLDDLRLLGEAPDRVVVLGIQPASLALGTCLSSPVASGLDVLVCEALDELAKSIATPAGEGACGEAHRTSDTLDGGYA